MITFIWISGTDREKNRIDGYYPVDRISRIVNSDRGKEWALVVLDGCLIDVHMSPEDFVESIHDLQQEHCVRF